MKITHLLEAPKQLIVPSTIDRLLSSEFSDAHNAKLPLFRGSGNAKPVIIDPKKFNSKRKSLTGDDTLMLLIDSLPSWKEFPSRRQCVIMTPDVNHTSTFGSPSLAYPKNGAKLGISTKVHDFNDYWPTNFGNIRRFIRDIATDISIDYSNGKPNEELVSLFRNSPISLRHVKLIDKFLAQRGLKISDYPSYLANSQRDNKHDTLFGYLNDYLLNPTVNGFKVITTAEMDSEPVIYEMWTDSPCLLIPQRYRSHRETGNWDFEVER